MNDHSDLEKKWIVNATGIVLVAGLGFGVFLLVLLARILWSLVG